LTSGIDVLQDYRKKQALIIICWILSFFMVAACSEKDDAAAIRELIKKGATLAEDHNVSEIMELTTQDVIALPGRYKRLEIKRIIWTVFKRYGQFKVLYPKPSVDLSSEGKAASCKIYLLILKKDRTFPGLKELTDDPKRWLETVGENADLYQVNLELLKKDGTWRVRQAHLESFKGLGFSE
jgi:hypothetical protein